MKKLLGLVFNEWVLTVLGLLALSFVIWIAGPLVSVGEWRPMESTFARWVTISAITLLALLRRAWRAWAAKRTNAKVVDQLMRPAESEAPVDAEIQVLNERFADALQKLKSLRFEAQDASPWSRLASRLPGKQHLYQLPWYAIIGAPGSGKTTALLNAGLNFALAAHDGKHAIKGVGGTRNCDWWFTDRAVLIDTAGRYTSQDSHEASDSRAWMGFLNLLKRSRPRQPLNGVIVTVSAIDLITRSQAEREADATAVRARVQELHRHLGMRFPIYLMVTKIDLLAGFVETLGEVDKETRETPWGMSFGLDGHGPLLPPLGEGWDGGGAQRGGTAPTPTLPQWGRGQCVFTLEFDALEKRLTNGLITALQSERDPQRRARIYGFPQQFDALRGVLKDFIEQVFSPSQFAAHPLLRGVYFVSGTQEGTPIDRMLGRLSRSYSLARAVPPAHQGSGRGYFLARLFKDVVFAEAGLAGTDTRWERRRRWLAAGAYAALAFASSITVLAWGVSYLGNKTYVNGVSEAAQGVQQIVRATPNRYSADLAALLPTLEATRDLSRAGVGDSQPWTLGFGLSQTRKLDAASTQAYRRMLVDAFLPRLALRVEEQLRNGTSLLAESGPELHYEALKAYVMLYDPTHFDAESLKLFITADWDAAMPRSTGSSHRIALESHLDALLGDGAVVSPMPQDKALLAQSRTRLASTPLAARVFRRLKRQGVGAEFPDFTVAQAAGPGAALVFTRASGLPLTQGVPGVFTHEGYHKGFQRAVDRVALQLADEEGWVLGVEGGARRTALRDMNTKLVLSDEVRRLYLGEYAKAWEEFIADIRMVKTANLAQAVQMARVLSAPDNPLVPLLKGMSRETTLRGGGAGGVAVQAETQARSALKQSREELAKLLGGASGARPVPPGQPIESLVDERFSALRRMVSSPDGKLPAPVDGTVALIGEVYALLTAADTAVKGGNVPPPSDVPNKVKAEAARLPEPVRSLLNTLSVSGTAAALEVTRSHIGNAIDTDIGEFCRQAIAGRYPFVRGSTRDVTQEDFAKLFAPGGLIDVFFQKNLAAFVDTTHKPWKFKSVDGVSLAEGNASLAQFQHAAAIRDTFFRAGQLGLKLDFKPLEMDAAITQFTLDVDGQLVKYAHGPQIPSAVQWPGPRGSSQVRVAVSPVSASGAAGTVNDGPWALFRLFDRQQLEPAGAPERFRASLSVDGRKAVFLVTASSVRNPFRLAELEAFSCPGKL